MHVIELNDAGVRITDGSGTALESPGYALLQADQLLLGDAARRQARLQPRHTNTHFWSRLSLDTLPVPGPRARTQADLAYAHLLDLWQQAGGSADGTDGEVVFAVPGQFDRNQLALLLGIARECPFQAVGLVDLAVAGVAATGAPPGTVLHLDAHLHRTVITRIASGEELQRDRVDDAGATALIALQDAMVGLIADAFIRETRFDPLHEAGTEQMLYDRLAGWLALLADEGEAVLELETGRSSYRVNLHQDRLVERLRPRYQQLAERARAIAGRDAHVVLGARLAGLPGLIDELGGSAGMEVSVAPEDAAVRGVLAHIDRIRRDSDSLAFVTRLPNTRTPATSPQASTQADTAAPVAEVPTHVLIGHVAHPLGAAALQIGGHDGVELPQHPQPVCSLRIEGGRCRLEPEPDALIQHEGQPVTGPLALGPGEGVVIGDGLCLTAIVVTTGDR